MAASVLDDSEVARADPHDYRDPSGRDDAGRHRVLPPNGPDEAKARTQSRSHLIAVTRNAYGSGAIGH